MSSSFAPGRGASPAPLRAGPWLLLLLHQAQWGEGVRQTVRLPEADEIDQMQVTRVRQAPALRRPGALY